MAKTKYSILDKVREEGLATPSAGMKVPDGYFKDFAASLSASLPERPELEEKSRPQHPRTMWEKMRPYVYMAAMFAGIWLMMQMFVSLKPGNQTMDFDKNPVLAEAMAGDNFIFDYVYPDFDEGDLVDEMIESDEIGPNFEISDLIGEKDDISDSTFILP